MTFEDLKKLPLLQTRGIAATITDDKTMNYVMSCLARFFTGDYGLIDPEDTDANNLDLESGYGHVLARYDQFGTLEGDFYIESHFDRDNLNDVNYSQTMIMYPHER